MIPPKHLIAYLRAHQTILDAVGTVSSGGADRIPIIGEMPSNTPWGTHMPRRLIVVMASGGPDVVGRNHDVRRGRQDVVCYGEDVADAWELSEIVYHDLRYGGRRRMGTVPVKSVVPSGGGIQSRTPNGNWPYVFTEYTVVIDDA